MAKFLIDANLPYHFEIWNNANFIHVKDLNESWDDETIWEYALTNNLTILTKDADFSLKVLYKGSPPKVVHFKIGNLRIRDLYHFISTIWFDIELLLENNKLINVYTDRIEAIK